MGVNLLLTTYYREIVYQYSEQMFNAIVRNKPTTLAQWKAS